jgi:hypothetical protein
MNKLYSIILIGFLILGCKEKGSASKAAEEIVVFNQALADELKKLAEVDQIAAYIPQGEYTKLSKEAWNSFKDSVFTTHQKRVGEIFNEHGFVGFDVAGKEGSENFWLLVQHSDHNPEFQQQVLEKMKIEVDKGNALPNNYGLLVDRVKLNTGEPQVYGTQVTYNMNIGQAYPKALADSATVNERRALLGLEPLENYLNNMSQSHFHMNKAFYSKKGIAAPTLYKVD